MGNNTKLTINDIPAETAELFKQGIHKDPQMQALVKKKEEALHNRNYIEVTKLSQQIKEIETRVINSYLAKYKGQAERMDLLMTDMKPEDWENMNIYTNAVIFLCDMIETLTMESEQILRKYHPDYKIEMFDAIVRLGKEAHAQVKFMSDNTDSVYQINFANGADDITELLLNKTKAFIRKIRTKSKKQ